GPAIDEAGRIKECPAEFAPEFDAKSDTKFDTKSDTKFDLEPDWMTGIPTPDFAKRLDKTAEETEVLLGKLLSDKLEADEIARPKRLVDAMRYSSLGGGKRLRPFLVVESAAVFGISREAGLLAGA